MELELPPQLQEFVSAQVRSGRYLDEQEVVRDALRQMRALVRAAEDPNLVGVVRDAVGIANQAQKDVLSMLQSADREQSMLGGVVGTATSIANSAYETARKVPGAREVDRLIRGPAEQVAAAAQMGELQARAMRQNLETTAKALGVLSALLERVSSAGRVIAPKDDKQ
jgi:putative addiction module CopG family antidote